jgi:hypothetical protein
MASRKAVALCDRAYPDRHYYIKLKGTERLVQRLAAGGPYLLLAPRQSGNSTESFAIAAALQSLGFQVVYVPLTVVSRSLWITRLLLDL